MERSDDDHTWERIPTRIISNASQSNNAESKHSQEVRQHLKAGFTKVTKLVKFVNLTQAHQGHNQARNTVFFTEFMKESIRNNLPGLENPSDLRNPHLFFDKQIFKYYNVSELKEGLSFGELALIRKRPRAATVVCVQETELAMISKQDYESILLDIEQRKYQKQVELFEKILNCDINKDAVTRIAYMFTKRKYNYGDKIYIESEEARELYLVKKGNVEISKSIKMKIHPEADFLKKESPATGSIRVRT
jgi:hypothetical protein